MIRDEVERLQRELERLAGASGVEGIMAATQVRDEMVRALQRARGLMTADLYYLKGMSLRGIAEAAGAGRTHQGVQKWFKEQLGQDQLTYVGVWQDRDGFHATSVPAESPEQIRKVMEEGVHLAPAAWELRASEVDPEDLWRRLTRMEKEKEEQGA